MSSASHNQDEDDDDDDENDEEEDQVEKVQISDLIRDIGPVRHFRGRTRRRRRPLNYWVRESKFGKDRTRQKFMGGVKKEKKIETKSKSPIVAKRTIPIYFKRGDIVKDIRDNPEFSLGEVVRETDKYVMVFELDIDFGIASKEIKILKTNVELERLGPSSESEGEGSPDLVPINVLANLAALERRGNVFEEARANLDFANRRKRYSKTKSKLCKTRD